MTRLSLVLTAACLLASCSESSPPSAPSPPAAANPEPAPAPQPQPAGSPIVSGVVYEYREGREPAPLAGFRFRAMIGEGESVPAVTDGQGRYSVTAVKGGMFVVIITEGGYRAPCPPGTGSGVAGDSRFDIDVVADATLTNSGVPASFPRPQTLLMVEGTVVEFGAQRQPLSGVTVELPAGWVGRSVTLTNARGEYFLCINPPGTGTDQMIPVRATKIGYRGITREISGANETRADFELVRE